MLQKQEGWIVIAVGQEIINSNIAPHFINIMPNITQNIFLICFYFYHPYFLDLRVFEKFSLPPPGIQDLGIY